MGKIKTFLCLNSDIDCIKSNLELINILDLHFAYIAIVYYTVF